MECGSEAGDLKSCKSALSKSGFAKNSIILILTCFFGCLFIVSSTYLLVSGQPFYGSNSNLQDGVQKDINTHICEQIATEYYKSHTYSESDIYDCDNMAQDVWNMLKAKGINARIAVGDFKPGNESRIEDKNSVLGTSDSGTSGLINVYNYRCKETGLLNSSTIDNLTHAWVLAEVSPGNWLAIECTGGYVVHVSEDQKYYSGLTFANPKNYRNFLELYCNWKTQSNDYENEQSCYNELLDTYNNDANNTDQIAMIENIETENARLREKEETFLKTDAEIQALMKYG